MADSVELLNNLHDIHAPPPVSWWPPAPGWWLLLGLLVLALALWWWRRRTHGWRHYALRELQVLEAEFQASADVISGVTRLSALLRRVALTVRPAANVAGLTGDAWLKFLDESAGMQQFNSAIGRMLTSAPYARAQVVELPALITLARAWVKKVS